MPNQLTDFVPIHLTHLTSLNPTPLTQSRTFGHCLDSILPDCHGPVAIFTFPWLPPKIALNYEINGVNPWKQQRSENVNHKIIISNTSPKKEQKTHIAFSKSDIFNLLLLYFGGRELHSSPSLETPKSDRFSGKLSTLTPPPPAWWLSSWPRKNLMLSMSIKRDINGRNIARV